MAVPRQMPSWSFFKPVTLVKPPASMRRRASFIVKLLRPFTGAAAVFWLALEVVTAGGAALVVLSGLRCIGVFVVVPGTVGPPVPIVPAVVLGGIVPVLPGVIDVGRPALGVAPMGAPFGPVVGAAVGAVVGAVVEGVVV